MKEIDEAVTSSPIEPVTEHDCRPLVNGLIDKHRAKIDKVQAELCKDPLYIKAKHDDLWILRFVMSHKKTEPALEAAKSTLAFRVKYKLDDTDIRKVPAQQKNEGLYKNFAKYFSDGVSRFAVPDQRRGVVAFIKLSAVDVDYQEMLKDVTVEEWQRAFIYIAEWTHQWLDYTTRATGRLTKSARFVDFKGVGLMSLPREGLKRDGDAMRFTEDAYPQLLETIYVCNPPLVLHLLYKLARMVMPKRVMEKVGVIDPLKNEHERARTYKCISEDDIPSTFGGQNKHYTEWNYEY